MGYTKAVRAEHAGAEEAERRSEKKEAQDPRTNCQSNPSGGAGSCKVCGVHVSESEYCSECNSPDTHAPVNGQCADVTQGSDKTLCPAQGQGKCTQCGGNSLLYMGGCYEASEGKPGYNLCTLASNGVCTEAAPGYFLNPLRASDKDSVVACSNTTGFTDAGKTYKGVQYCEACDGLALTKTEGGTAKCTRCQEQKYLKDNACVDSAAACGNGYAAKKDSKNGNRCVLCTDKTEGVTNCETCEYNTQSSKIKCTKCSGSNYLTTVDGATTCKTECGEGYFKNDNGGSDSQTKVCVSCSDSAHGGVNGCTTCTPKEGDPTKAKCTACGNSKIVKTAKDKTTTCVTEDECASTAGFFAKGSTSKTCETCDVATYGVTDCTTCAPKAGSPDQATCTACATGKKPNADGTSCFDCPDTGCSQCSAANQCAICINGYRKTDSNTCEKCTPEHCKVCTNDAKICTECVTGYAPSADGSSCASSSANRSGLSIGAIAGISVAAVVVVGGLVGFLCWWFVCRGKA